MPTKTATATAVEGGPTTGGGLGNMGVASLLRKAAEKVGETAPKSSAFKGGSIATPDGGSTSGGGIGGMGVASNAWRLAAEKAGIDVESLSQTEMDILRTGGVKAYQEYMWEDERAKAKK
jgi:hypothetical protein